MKLGLIAMSGVRAHNEELTRLGLTLPGFVSRNKVIASLPSLGLLTLAAMTPREIDLTYIELPGEVGELPGEFDAVAISSFSARIYDAYKLADLYRAAGTRVILGGLHVTALPDEAANHADAVVIGEGEPVWGQVMADLLHDNVQPVYDARPTPFDFVDAPIPRYDLIDPSVYNRLTVQTQRGCPFNCEFCASSVRLSPVYKLKPIDKVIAEIHAIKAIWPNPFIEFADDNTFVNKKQSKELMRALAKEYVKWFAETDISVADDEALLDMMRDAGCAEILIGLESLSPAGLEGLETKSNWKAQKLDTYRDSVTRIQGHGIAVNGCFVLGLDGTGTESFDQIIDFSRECGLFDVQVTVLTAFPGTPLYSRLKKEGRIIRDKAWELCTLFDINFTPQKMNVKELDEHFRQLVKVLYSDEFTRERRRTFRNQMRAHMRSRMS
jgi:radical SAM superfamily enzyme YgiQ (UPF0313 family)